jgi:hypothetical protein
LFAAARGQVPVPNAPTAGQASPVEKQGLKGWQIALMIIGGVLGLFFLVGLALSATVLSSLNEARDKGQDAAIKTRLSNFRASAELYADGNDPFLSYEGYCEDVRSRLSDSDIQISCEATEDRYVITAALTDGSYYCVDSTGSAEELTTPPIGDYCQ